MEPIGNVRLFNCEQSEPTPEYSDAPAVPLHLIDWLELQYTNHLPMQPVTDWELGRLVGQQDVIQVLRQLAGRRT